MKNFERELGYLDTADGVAAPYSPAWLEAALDCNDRPGTHRRLRAARRTGSTRIRVSLVSTYDCGGGPAYIIDETDAFGWRAALAAARYMRRERAFTPHRDEVFICIDDARLIDSRGES
jgi:hypothetical protein